MCAKAIAAHTRPRDTNLPDRTAENSQGRATEKVRFEGGAVRHARFAPGVRERLPRSRCNTELQDGLRARADTAATGNGLTQDDASAYDSPAFVGVSDGITARGVVSVVASACSHQGETLMAEARKIGKTELFAHFVEHFAAVNISIKRADAREFFEELQRLCEQQLQDCGEFTLPGIAKLVLQKREARTGRNPATGEAIEIPTKQVVKARIAKQLKDAVLPEA